MLEKTLINWTGRWEHSVLGTVCFLTVTVFCDKRAPAFFYLLQKDKRRSWRTTTETFLWWESTCLRRSYTSIKMLQYNLSIITWDEIISGFVVLHHVCHSVFKNKYSWDSINRLPFTITLSILICDICSFTIPFVISLQVRMKSMFAIGFCFTALMGMFNSM